MIEIFDSKTIFDIFSYYTENNNCALVYFKNTALECCKNQKLKDEVFSFYEEFLPEDMLLILKRETYSAVQFKSTDEAIINITSWFPSRDLLKSDEYYWYACIIDNNGDIVFENRLKPTA
jgi:hypothetical protein